MIRPFPRKHCTGFMQCFPNFFRQYRTKSVWRLCTQSACKFPFRACFVSSRTHLACIFSEIFRENTRKSTKDFLRFPLHLSKNLTTQSAYVRYETDSHISQNAREYIKYSLRFLFHLTKNLTTHLPHNLCAVLPKIGKEKECDLKN